MRITEASLSIQTEANEEVYQQLNSMERIIRLGGGFPFDLPKGQKRISLEVELETDEPIGIKGTVTDAMTGDDCGFMIMEAEFRLDDDERLYNAVGHILGTSTDVHLKPRADRTPDEQKTVEDALREKVNNLHAGHASLRRKLERANAELEEMYDKWQEAVAS